MSGWALVLLRLAVLTGGWKLNWNSMIKAAGACAIYIALMGAYLADFSPLSFALYSAVLFYLGLSLHNAGLVPVQRGYHSVRSILPSVSDSMAELHELQNEINQLQAQFAAESAAQGNRSRPNESTG